MLNTKDFLRKEQETDESVLLENVSDHSDDESEQNGEDNVDTKHEIKLEESQNSDFMRSTPETKYTEKRANAQERLHSLIMKGSTSIKKIKADTRLLSTLFTEDDFHMDEHLALKVRDGTFLKNLHFDDLTPNQQATAKIVSEHLGESFKENIMKKSRRLSLSLQTKRKKPRIQSPDSKIPVVQKSHRDSDDGQHVSNNK